MIDNIQILLKNGIVLTYTKHGEGVEKTLEFSKLFEYWDYADDEEEPYLSVGAVGNMIYGIMTIAESQGGIIFIYDCDTEKVVHVSNGDYGVDFDVEDGYVYLLCYVSNFVTKGHFMIFRTEYGVKDSIIEGTAIQCDLPDADDPLNARIGVDGRKLTVLIDGKEHVIEI